MQKMEELRKKRFSLLHEAAFTNNANWAKLLREKAERLEKQIYEAEK